MTKVFYRPTYVASINTINSAEKVFRMICENPHRFPPKVQERYWQRLCRLKQEHNELFGSITPHNGEWI